MSLYSTPWVPSVNGNACSPCVLYDPVVASGVVPNPWSDPDWARENLKMEFEGKPDAPAAVWEGILALWRLRLREKDGGGDETWRSVVSAWLVRHRGVLVR